MDIARITGFIAVFLSKVVSRPLKNGKRPLSARGFPVVELDRRRTRLRVGLNPLGQTNRWIVFLHIYCVISTHSLTFPNLSILQTRKLQTSFVIRLFSTFLLALWPLEKSISSKMERDNTMVQTQGQRSDTSGLPFPFIFPRPRITRCAHEEGEEGRRQRRRHLRPAAASAQCPLVPSFSLEGGRLG